jgi:hypothetical protein
MSLKETLNTLFSGAVICEVSHPNLVRFLADTENHDKVVEVLGYFGKKLASSSQGHAVYMTLQDGSPEALREIAMSSKEKQEEYARMGRFIAFMLEVNDVNGRLAMGDEIRTGALSKSVDDSIALRDSLKNLASIMKLRGSTDATRVSDLLRKMKDNGYLKLVDSQRQHYLVTAKIQLVYDGLEHFMANIPAVADAVSKLKEDVAQGQEELL